MDQLEENGRVVFSSTPGEAESATPGEQDSVLLVVVGELSIGFSYR